MSVVLRPYQLECIEGVAAAARRGAKVIILQAATGCHRYGQAVLGYNGFPQIVQDVKVGDQLMGPDSQPRTVLRLCRGRDTMYRIIPSKGNPFVVNGDHVLTLCRTRKRSAKVTWKRRRSDAKSHIDGQIVDVTVREWLSWNKTMKHIHKLFRVGVTFKPGPSLSMDPYFLGVLLGDGCMVGTPAVTTIDKEIVEEATAQAAKYGLRLMKSVDSIGRAPSYRFSSCIRQAGSNQLTASLRHLGLINKRAASKDVPHEFMVASEKNRLELLAGLLDTDGSLSNNCYDFISKSPALAHNVEFLARSCGLAAHYAPCIKYDQDGAGGVYFRVSISGEIDKVPCRIPRKQASPRLQKKNALRTGFTVEELGVEDYYGFTLDGDGRYLLDDFTVTHNSGKTSMACEIIRRALSKGSRVLEIVHRRRLVEQFSQRLDEFGVYHGVLMRGHRYERLAPVQVASRDTLLARAFNNDYIAPPPAELVIVDEGRHAAAPEFRRLLEPYEKAGAVIVLLDATPVLSDGTGLGPWAQAIVCATKTSQLIQDGFLVPLKVFAPDRTVQRGQVSQRGVAGDLVESWKHYAENQPTILFTGRVQHSRDAVAAFLRAGIRAAHVDAKTPDEERDEVYDGLATGRIQVVCNVGIIKEGVDIPCLGCCQIYMSMNSRVGLLQAVGRIMRPYPGKKYGLLIDHSAAVYRLGFPDEDTEWTLEGNVDDLFNKKHEQGDTEKPLYCKVCALVYKGQLTCPQCGRMPAKRPRSIFDPPEMHASNEILTEADRQAERGVFGREEKIAFWYICLRTALKKGSNFKAASMIFKNKYKVYPDRDFPMLPTWEDMGKKILDVYPDFGRRKVDSR